MLETAVGVIIFRKMTLARDDALKSYDELLLQHHRLDRTYSASAVRSA
jgi:hypothetical protein